MFSLLNMVLCGLRDHVGVEHLSFGFLFLAYLERL